MPIIITPTTSSGLLIPKIVYGSSTLLFSFPPVQKPGTDDLEAEREDSVTLTGKKQSIFVRRDKFFNLQMDFVPQIDLPNWAAFMDYALQGNPFDYYPDGRNLLLSPEALDDAIWGKTNVTITPNATTAPDGSSNADLLAANAGSAQHVVVQDTVITVVGAKYVFSVFAKPSASNLVTLTANGEADSIFDVNAGTISSSGARTCSMTSVGSGWYRCQAAGIKLNSSPAFYLGLDSSGIYSGAGKSAYLWGAEVEQGAVASPYTNSSPISCVLEDTKWNPKRAFMGFAKFSLRLRKVA